MGVHAFKILRRPEKLVLPKPVLDYVSTSMKRDSSAILGPNEVQLYDVGEHGHAVCVWNFTDGKIRSPSGGLELILRLLQHVVPTIRTGVAIADPSSSELKLHVHNVVFHKSGRVEYARVGSERESLLTKVSTTFGVPNWRPHGVMGGRTVRLTDTGFELGRTQCLASSRHLTHPEIALKCDPATLVTFFINYFMPSIPSIDVLETAVKQEQTFGLENGFPGVYLIGSLNASGEIEVRAWQLGILINPQAVADLRQQMIGETARQFNDLTALNHYPPGIVEFKVKLWMRLFEERVRNRLMVEIPIEDQDGSQITTLKV